MEVVESSRKVVLKQGFELLIITLSEKQFRLILAKIYI